MQALSYIDEDFFMQLDGPYLEKAEAIKIPIHLNMAAVQLRMGDCNTAIYNCSEVSAQAWCARACMKGALWWATVGLLCMLGPLHTALRARTTEP